MKYIATMALMLNLGVASVYAQHIPVKTTSMPADRLHSLDTLAARRGVPPPGTPLALESLWLSPGSTSRKPSLVRSLPARPG